MCYRKAFAPIHPPGTLSMLDVKSHIGPVDPATLPTGEERITDEERRIQKARAELPPPEGALNLHDIEVASSTMYLRLGLWLIESSAVW